MAAFTGDTRVVGRNAPQPGHPPRSLNNLPAEVQNMIAVQLSPLDLLTFARVCRAACAGAYLELFEDACQAVGISMTAGTKHANWRSLLGAVLRHPGRCGETVCQNARWPADQIPDDVLDDEDVGDFLAYRDAAIAADPFKARWERDDVAPLPRVHRFLADLGGARICQFAHGYFAKDAEHALTCQNEVLCEDVLAKRRGAERLEAIRRARRTSAGTSSGRKGVEPSEECDQGDVEAKGEGTRAQWESSSFPDPDEEDEAAAPADIRTTSTELEPSIVDSGAAVPQTNASAEIAWATRMTRALACATGNVQHVQLDPPPDPTPRKPRRIAKPRLPPEGNAASCLGVIRKHPVLQHALATSPALQVLHVVVTHKKRDLTFLVENEGGVTIGDVRAGLKQWLSRRVDEADIDTFRYQPRKPRKRKDKLLRRARQTEVKPPTGAEIIDFHLTKQTPGRWPINAREGGFWGAKMEQRKDQLCLVISPARQKWASAPSPPSRGPAYGNTLWDHLREHDNNDHYEIHRTIDEVKCEPGDDGPVEDGNAWSGGDRDVGSSAVRWSNSSDALAADADNAESEKDDDEGEGYASEEDDNDIDDDNDKDDKDVDDD
ncbi:hypothetical protein Q5752_002948 [Cryptotrichosporon argae]